MILGTFAHELAHASQLGYDPDEVPGNDRLADCSWFMESTATWVSYKVMKALGQIPAYPYGLLDHLWVPPPGEERSWPPLFDHLHENLSSYASRYGSWLFFYSASTFVDAILKVTFQNLLVGTPGAHVWAIKKVGSDWKEPEDWTKDEEKVFCRNPEELGVACSASSPLATLSPTTPVEHSATRRVPARAVSTPGNGNCGR